MPKSVLIRLNNQNTKEAYSCEKQYNTDNGKIHQKYRRNIQRSSLATGTKDFNFCKGAKGTVLSALFDLNIILYYFP